MKYYIAPSHYAGKQTFIVRDEEKNKTYEVRGRVFISLRWLELRHIDGTLLYRARRRFTVGLHRRYDIQDANGRRLGSVGRTYGPFRPTFSIQLEDKTYHIVGSLFQHDFALVCEGDTACQVEKKVFSDGDAFEITVETKERPGLYLFVLLLIDQFIHEKKRFFR